MADPAIKKEQLRSSINDLSEDALGFGGLELRTVWQLVRDPKAVLDAWMTAGPSGGGAYTRPFRLYMGLNAILMLFLFLQGGAAEKFLSALPQDGLSELIAQSGKSRDAFIADADGWMSLTLVPILSIFYALAATPLLRLWDPDALGWKRGFRAAFAYLCAWTVLVMPIAWWTMTDGLTGLIVNILIITFAVIAFLRMGAGRWWRSPVAGFCKGLMLAVAVQLTATLGFLPVLGIGLIAGRFF